MLNNDTEVNTGSWINDMLGYAQQPDIAAVGAKLLYPSGQIQHAGVTMGIGSLQPVAAHSGNQMMSEGSTDPIQIPYTHTIRDVSGVTAACLMVSKEKYWEVGGFDSVYRVTFNDVDLCLKFREKGYTNIYLPFVQLTHHESISVGRASENRDMTELHASAKLMRKRWGVMVDYDPFYNQNFDILSSQFDLDVYHHDAVK
jgi:GT2 family glycosyltransferase